jgi:hypothetical protein
MSNSESKPDCPSCKLYYASKIKKNLCSMCFEVSETIIKIRPGEVPFEEINQYIKDRQTEKDIAKQKNIDSINYEANKYVIDDKILKNILKSTIDLKNIEPYVLCNKLKAAIGNYYLSWNQAKEIYSELVMKKENIWKYEHALCCLVIDTWNIEDKVMTTGYCYYGSPPVFAFPSKALFRELIN